MLGVSPNTLRSWERRYGYPFPERSAGGHRLYDLAQIEALRATLGDTQNVSSAISVARERGAGPSSSARLATAFSAFEEEAADRLLEESLTLRSFERTIEELLLPAVESLTPASADFEFGARHASAWISAVNRLSPSPSRPEAVLLLDASARLDLDALHAQALELMLRRGGIRTLLLSSAVELTRLGRAVRAVAPAALVLTGRHGSLDGIGRIVFAVRGVVPGIAVYDFRGAVPFTGATTVTRLGDQPTEARERLIAEISGRATSAPARAPQERAPRTEEPRRAAEEPKRSARTGR
jgi:DNA-binding transcriptional MerR regulator